MTERAARPRARRPPLSQTVLRLAAAAVTASALVWTALFYAATRDHAVAASPPTTQLTPGDGAVQPAPAPLTTRTS